MKNIIIAVFCVLFALAFAQPEDELLRNNLRAELSSEPFPAGGVEVGIKLGAGFGFGYLAASFPRPGLRQGTARTAHISPLLAHHRHSLGPRKDRPGPRGAHA